MPRQITYQDFLRTGPGTLAGRYLRRFWQPVASAADVSPGGTKRLQVMGEEFTLSRDAAGVLRLDNGSRPVHESIGLVFAFLGQGLPPPVPSYPEFETKGCVRSVRTGVWPCNYFAQLDNAVDTLHTSFVHWQFGRGVGSLRVEPTESGLVTIPNGPGADYPNFFDMPNSHEWATPPAAGRSAGWDLTKGWRVPVDDNHHARFDVSIAPAAGGGDEAPSDGRAPADSASTWEFVQAVLAGRRSVKEAEGRPDLVTIQDLVALVGLGPIAQQPPVERLGRSDVGLIQMRKLWAEELRALVDGRPLREWRRSANPVWPELLLRSRVAPR